MDQLPSVGSEIFPANFFGVMPQSTHLKFKIGHKVTMCIKRSELSYLKDNMFRGQMLFTCPVVSPVCHKAFLRCSPGPVVELTTLMDSPE